jgi:hypothetical protein
MYVFIMSYVSNDYRIICQYIYQQKSNLLIHQYQVNIFQNPTTNDPLRKLIIEQWNFSRMHEGYYNECQPAECVYSYETRNDVVYIIVTVFGLIGGLITILKLIIPRLIKIIFYCIRKWRMRIVSIISVSENQLLYKQWLCSMSLICICRKR